MKYSTMYKTLDKVDLSLREDPSSDGVSSINKTIAYFSRKKDEVLKMYCTAIVHNSSLDTELRRLKALKAASISKILSEDEDVKKGKSAGERQSLAEQKKEIVEVNKKLEGVSTAKDKASAFIECVRLVHNSIRDIEKQLSKQIWIVSTEMQLSGSTGQTLDDIRKGIGKDITNRNLDL